jgi:cobalt-zinc-cadmium efflux system membrane fusion protein
MSEIEKKSVDILVVDDDEVLAQVVGRVLSQQGFAIRHAATVRRALEMARLRPPGLALLDLCLPDGNGVELARSLRQRHAGLPLLLMTAYPLREKEKPVLAELGAEVLTKPFSPETLRQAVSNALAAPALPSPTWGKEEREPKAEKTNPFIPSSTSEPRPSERAALVKESPMHVFLVKFSKTAGLVVVSVVVLIGLAMALGLRAPWLRASDEKVEAPQPKAAGLAAELRQVELVPNMPHTLELPSEVRETLGIRKRGVDVIHIVDRPKNRRELVLPGSSGIDPTRLYRVRARFAPSPSSAKCTYIEKVPDEDRGQSPFTPPDREIRSGDRVKKGQVLAVFESVDVGSKKNDLIDAMVQLKLDEDLLDRGEKTASSGGLSEFYLLNLRRAVEGDRNAVARARNTLSTWDIPERDIEKVEDEAKKIIERQGKRDPNKAKEWARVELRAPDDGIVIERNLALNEIVVDNTTNLFQIAKVDRLSVYAYCPEDDLPALLALPTAERTWTVQTVGRPPASGVISDISYLIDPNQHTAVVKGYMNNPEEVVRAGQFVSATIQLPLPTDVVEIPAEAVAEDGQQAVVFVQTNSEKHYYTMRRVHLEARFDKKVWVRSKPFAKGEQRTSQEEELGVLPKEPLVPGDRILPTAVGELKVALLDRESQPEKK